MRRFCFGTSAPGRAVSDYFFTIAHELGQRGHEVNLLVDGQRTDLVRLGDTPAVHTWPSPRPTRPADARFILEFLGRHRPDCIVGNFGSVNLMMLAGKLRKIPVRAAWYRTLSSQLTEPKSATAAWRRLRKRFVYASASRVIANSRAARADVVKTYRIHPSRVLVREVLVPDPLGTELSSLEPIAHRIVRVGRFHPSKGQDVLIRAIARQVPRYPALEVEFLGDGDTLPACRALAESHNVLSHCRFLGESDRPRALHAMRQARVVVVPSREEAFGLVNVEALSVGSPVVASNVGGIVDIIDNGETGYLVPPGDPDPLSARLLALLSDDALRWRMSEAARRAFLTRYGPENLSAHADWFEHLAEGKH